MKEYLQKILLGEELTRAQAHDLLLGIAGGLYPDPQIASLLTAIKMRGVGVDEILGFRDSLLETGVSVRFDDQRFIDVVGTGGDGKDTFNISTLACFVVAGAGYKVAKHGNYSATSTSGASNVIEAHGVKFTSDPSRLRCSLEKSGVAYLHAPLFAKAMKAVAPVRRALPFPTVFNLLGPIVNPSTPPCQMLGVATLDQMRLYGSVYKRLGVKYSIVNSLDGYDEISLTGDFKVLSNHSERIYSPAELGLGITKPEQLCAGGSRTEAVRIFDAVLDGSASREQKDTVLANAAFAIKTLEGEDISLEDCLGKARESLQSGRAAECFRRFVELNS